MQKQMTVVLCGMVLAGIMSGVVSAGETGHYPLGVEGLKAASVPPPGLYLRNYLLYYNANVSRYSANRKLMPPNFADNKLKKNSGFGTDVDALIWAPRMIWITDQKVMDADYGMSVLLPIGYQDVELRRLGMADNDFCIGDLCVEPLILGWHGEQWDIGAGYALWFPVGRYEEPTASSNHLANMGKDHWTNMFTFGGTYFLDAEKTWHASALSRYEIHSRKDHTDVKPGQNIVLEWGVGKTLGKIWDVGIIGYANWQLSDDTGSDVPDVIEGIHDRVAAIGPEVSVFIPPIKSILSLRAAWEFSAVDRPEGATVVLTFTKIF